ncbi:DNA-processing protein DprA [Cellulomonas olei]|uniref:DNA-processing protein DprA n=1 Tax=Cellulomonas sp. P4 TaxID=3142533 RepID=UPI0031B9AE39
MPGAPAAGRSPGAAGTDGPRGTGGLLGTDSARPPGATAPDARDERWLRVVGRALERWAPRLADLDPLRALDRADAVGAVVLHPGHPDWPHGLDDLGPAAPLALWVRGPADPAALLGRAVAVVGARAATVYGRRVASDLAGGLAARDVTVVSGGAFGIDVAAHRAALAAGGVSVAFLAGGIDRPSPVANLDVLEALVAGGGALVAESPPGSTPTRSRFLQRNRLIAACTRATVVVEAAWRSGALSTASRAAELLRPVGAVPGPVTSMASAGCHRLLRDGGAVCITGVDDVLELVGPPPSTRPPAPAPGPGMRSAAESTGGVPRAVAPGAQDSPHREGRRGVLDDGPGGRGALDDGPGGRGRLGEGPPGRAAVGEAPTRHPAVEHTHGARSSPAAGTGRGTAAQAERAAADRADSVESRVLDAMPRGSADVPEIARRAGLAVRDVQSALGLLELRRVVERSPAGWRRVRASRGR